MYRQWSIYVPSVVTICTAGLTFSNSTFWTHSVIMCFMLTSEQADIISLYSTDCLVWITDSVPVYCAVRTEYLICVININVRIERAKTLGVTLHVPTALYCQTEQCSQHFAKYSLRPLGNASYWSTCHVCQSWESGIPYIRNQMHCSITRILQTYSRQLKFLGTRTVIWNEFHPQRGPTNIRHHSTKFSCPGYITPEICIRLIYDVGNSINIGNVRQVLCQMHTTISDTVLTPCP
jgi:hypothetical protein